MDWAVEVLVTRSELDEKKSRMAELEQQASQVTGFWMATFFLLEFFLLPLLPLVSFALRLLNLPSPRYRSQS